MVPTSDKSAIEFKMKDMVTLCDDIIDDNYLTTRDARKIVDLLSQGLLKIEELRISRDNWRDKFKDLKKSQSIKIANNHQQKRENTIRLPNPSSCSSMHNLGSSVGADIVQKANNKGDLE